MSEQPGNDFFHEKIRMARHEFKEINYEVWQHTPFMLDVMDDNLRHEIRNWCNHEIGSEAFHHSDKGAWRTGNVTMKGRTWYGFKTAELLNKFVEKYPMLCCGVIDEKSQTVEEPAKPAQKKKISIKDGEEKITVAAMRELFEKSMQSTRLLQGVVLGTMEINGQFSHYMDEDTDNLWIGFAIGMRCAERILKAADIK